MKVIVTGGAGFIGSHTVDKLIAGGNRVLVIDNLSTGKLENLNPTVELVRRDISTERLDDIFSSFQPEGVIHLAGQVSVAKSVTDPLGDCTINILGCLNLLQACIKYRVKRVVYSSSAAVYGSQQETVLSESDRPSPLSFYGVSKLAPEYYLKVYNHLYGLKYAVLRYANVYGPRQDASGEGGVISIFATRIISGEAPVVFGDGEQTRDFVYVEDVAAANHLALSRGDERVINIGTGMEMSVNGVYKLLAGLAGVDLPPVHAPARKGDIKNSCMSSRDAADYLGWQPAFSLRDGLAKTLEFYRG